MKYSISNWIYGEEKLQVTLERLKKCGYDGVELEGEPDNYSTKKVKDLCEVYDLEVLSIAGIYPWPTEERDLSNPDEKVRKRAIEYLKKCCDWAGELGAPLITVVPSAVAKTKPVSDPQTGKQWIRAVKDEWNYGVDSVREAGDYAQKVGVSLAIEPLNRYETFLVNNVQEGLKFISEVNSDVVKIHLDTFHMNIEETDLGGAVRQAGQKLVNLHIADSNREAVGRGHLNFKALIKVLVSMNYDKALALEPLPPVPEPYMAAKLYQSKYEALRDKYAEESIQNLKKYEKEVRKK